MVWGTETPERLKLSLGTHGAQLRFGGVPVEGAPCHLMTQVLKKHGIRPPKAIIAVACGPNTFTFGILDPLAKPASCNQEFLPSWEAAPRGDYLRPSEAPLGSTSGCGYLRVAAPNFLQFEVDSCRFQLL